MSKYVLLSYPLSKKTTFLPKSIGPPKVHARSRMVPAPENIGETETRWGSYNNTSILEMCLHTGTHIDFPFHVDPKGYTLNDFDISDFIFEKPLFLHLPKEDMEDITREDLHEHEFQLKKCDLLLIYTGFSKYRLTDPERYENKQPSISVEAAKYIVDNFSNIRSLGVDLLGIENIGKARPEFPAHKVLLVGRKFFHIEDVNLEPALGKRLKKVYVVPLWLLNVEAAPATILAEVE
ncbi:MAG: cyclase family protein [Candidatus Odinarchaeota archaeon]|nr:cyclase family protein [Candidatus Odinarchaeota archaeon]